MEIQKIKAENEKESESMREHFDELQKTLSESNANDLVQPEVWKLLSPNESKLLRRWVNQFIKANLEKTEQEADMVAYPFMNKKLRKAMQRVTAILQKRQLKRIAEVIKAEKKEGSK